MIARMETIHGERDEHHIVDTQNDLKEGQGSERRERLAGKQLRHLALRPALRPPINISSKG